MIERVPDDPAEHARQFAETYADRLENFVEGRMHALDIPEEMIGASDHERGVAWRVFFPSESVGGGVSPGGRINVDSGVLNPDLMAEIGVAVAQAWARTRLCDRIDASITHEYEEAVSGSHAFAVAHAPETALAITERVRTLLRVIANADSAD